MQAQQQDLIRKLVYRCQHRGMLELDIILGGFAETNLAAFSADQLASFATIINYPDPIFTAILLQQQSVMDIIPAASQGERQIWQQLLAYKQQVVTASKVVNSQQ